MMPQAGQPRPRAACQILRVVIRASLVVAVVFWIRSMVAHDCGQLSVCRSFVECEFARGQIEFYGGWRTDQVKKPPDTLQFYSMGVTAFPVSAGGPHEGGFGAEILRGRLRSQIGFGAGTFGVEMFRYRPSPVIGLRVVMPCWLPVCCGVLVLGALEAAKVHRIHEGFPVGNA